MSWTPPDDYQPKPGLDAELKTENTPAPGTALFRIISMVSSKKTPQQVGLTPEQARELIDGKMVPMDLYDSVLSVALSDAD